MTTEYHGRQLLSLKNRIASERDEARLKKLRKKEVLLLAELGNFTEALAFGKRLISDYSGWPAGHAFLADISCRAGRWKEAEDLFKKAANLHDELGNVDSAIRLRTGPIFRLTEARSDFCGCLELCGNDSELEIVLSARSRRRLGEKIPLPSAGYDRLAGHLLILERAWQGASSNCLLDEALEWEGAEPEWRWRFLVESIDIWQNQELNIRKWLKPVRKTVCPVLDPRFSKEWSRISHDCKF